MSDAACILENERRQQVEADQQDQVEVHEERRRGAVVVRSRIGAAKKFPQRHRDLPTCGIRLRLWTRGGGDATSSLCNRGYEYYSAEDSCVATQ